MITKGIIYLVDDDADDRFVYREIFLEICPGLVILEAANGLDLMRSILSNPAQAPSLLLIDMNMPTCNGIETIGLVRGNELSAQVPAVMISTSNDRWLVDMAIGRGYNEFYRKPAMYSEIAKLVSKLIGKYLLPCLE